MRTLRRHVRRLPVPIAALVGCAMLGALTIPLAAADDGSDLKDQQAQVDKDKQAAAEAAEESSGELQKAAAALKAAQKRLAKATQQLEKANADLAAARKAHRKVKADLVEQRGVLAAAKVDLATARKRAERQRDRARDTILNRYTSSADPRLQEVAALIQGAPLEEIVRRRDFADAVTSSQTTALRRLQAGERLVSRRAAGERAATAKVAAKETESRQQVTAMKKLEVSAKKTQEQIAELTETAASAKKKAAKAAAHDKQVLEDLKAQDAAIAAKIAGLAAGAKNQTLATTTHMLGLPVADTYVTQAYGPRVNPVTGESEIHDGIDLHAPCGTPELAAMSGTVVSEEWNDAYGNRLFLFLGKINGHSYTAIYNHISAYKSSVGDKVKKGATLSLAGDTGWVTACHLHFMIQKDGTTVNPTSYLPTIPNG